MHACLSHSHYQERCKINLVRPWWCSHHSANRLLYNKEPFLLNFLIHYNYASPKACGYDVTVGSITDNEDWEV